MMVLSCTSLVAIGLHYHTLHTTILLYCEGGCYDGVIMYPIVCHRPSLSYTTYYHTTVLLGGML